MSTSITKVQWHQVKLPDGRSFNFLTEAKARAFNDEPGGVYVGTVGLDQTGMPFATFCP